MLNHTAFWPTPSTFLRPSTSHIPTHFLSNDTLNAPSRRLFSSLSVLQKPNQDHLTSEPAPSSTLTDIDATPKLTHLTSTSTAHMVHLPASKPSTARSATATSIISFSNAEPATLIRAHALKKGDVLAVARIAGIMAAKRTAETVVLCHNIPLSGVEVNVEVFDGGGNLEEQSEKGNQLGEFGFGGVKVTATVRTNAQTGVEMEALMAVTAAGLTVYDMCKGVDRGMVIGDTRVVRKEGGRSGTWVDGVQVE